MESLSPTEAIERLVSDADDAVAAELLDRVLTQPPAFLERLSLRLLQAMGWETANIHLGSVTPRVLRADLKKRPRGWLLEAARKMAKAVTADFQDYSRVR